MSAFSQGSVTILTTDWQHRSILDTVWRVWISTRYLPVLLIFLPPNEILQSVVYQQSTYFYYLRTSSEGPVSIIFKVFNSHLFICQRYFLVYEQWEK